MIAPPVVLAAHGSRDPASSATMRALAARVARVWPAPVAVAFLDFDQPSIPDALADLAGGCGSGSGRAAQAVPVVVPALLTHAYHRRVDLPGVLADVPYPTTLADVLGPDPLLVAGLRRRLSELVHPEVDGVVLIAAGTSDEAARSTVEAMAAELGRQLDVACRVGYASASAPTPGEAVLALRDGGARRIVGASYFLATGRLYSAAVRSAVDAGAIDVAAPLGTADELVHLIVARALATQNGQIPDTLSATLTGSGADTLSATLTGSGADGLSATLTGSGAGPGVGRAA